VEDELRILRETREILDTVNDLFVGTDDRDWNRVARALSATGASTGSAST
jgi:hypothetical protein